MLSNIQLSNVFNVDVEHMIEERHFQWLESIGLSDIPSDCKTNPPGFVFWLVFTLLGDGKCPIIPETNIPSDESNQGLLLLQEVRSFLMDHEQDGTPLSPHLSSILLLSNPAAVERHPEGRRCLNGLIQTLRDYLTPTVACEEHISQVLAKSEKECEVLVHEIERVSRENLFYQQKFEALERFLQAQPDGPDRQFTEAIVSKMFDPPVLIRRGLSTRRPGPTRELGSLVADHPDIG
jgi:hypothetical protein